MQQGILSIEHCFRRFLTTQQEYGKFCMNLLNMEAIKITFTAICCSLLSVIIQQDVHLFAGYLISMTAQLFCCHCGKGCFILDSRLHQCHLCGHRYFTGQEVQAFIYKIQNVVKMVSSLGNKPYTIKVSSK